MVELQKPLLRYPPRRPSLSFCLVSPVRRASKTLATPPYPGSPAYFPDINLNSPFTWALLLDRLTKGGFFPQKKHFSDFWEDCLLSPSGTLFMLFLREPSKGPPPSTFCFFFFPSLTSSARLFSFPPRILPYTTEKSFQTLCFLLLLVF